MTLNPSRFYRFRSSGSSAWGRRGIALTAILLVAGVLLWFAPTIAMHTPLRQTVLQAAKGGFAGHVETGSISVGWLSPVVVSDVNAWDEEGNLLFAAPVVRTEHSLLALLSDRSDVGRIRVEQPRIQVLLGNDRSNVETTLEGLLGGEPSSAPTRSGGTIEIVQGLVSIEDQATGRRWTVSKVDATLSVPAQVDGEIAAQFRGGIGAEAGVPGEFSGQLAWRRGESGLGERELESHLGIGRAQLDLRGFPLELTEPLIRRYAPRTFIGGLLSGSLQVAWGGEGEQLRLQNGLVEHLLVVAPQWLGEDRFALPAVQASAELARQGAQWQVRDLTLASEVCSLRGVGAGPLDTQAALGSSAWFTQIWRQGGYQVAANIDLARLASLLPRTLHIRSSTQITAGRMTASIVSQPGAGGQTSGAASQWDLQFAVADLAGSHAGRAIQLAQPVEARLTARQADGGWRFENVTCTSSFGSLKGSGTSLAGTLAADADLTQLARELEPFVDLGQLQLAGRLNGEVHWQQTGPDAIAIEGSADADQFVLATEGQPEWREDRLNVTFTAIGHADTTGLHGLRQGRFVLQSGADRLEAELAGPVAPLSLDATVSLRAALQGELRTWMPRLARFVAMPAGWQISGAIQAAGELAAATTQTRIASATVDIQGLEAHGPAIVLSEPVVKVNAAGAWDATRSELFAEKLTVATSALALQAAGLRVSTGVEGFQASGDMGYRADLARLSAAIRTPGTPDRYRLAGQATGNVRLAHQAAATSATWTMDVADFSCDSREVAGTPATRPISANGAWTPLWTEAVLKSAGQGRYLPGEDRIQFDKLEVAGSAASIAARGEIAEPLGACLVAVDGQVAYDLQAVTTRLRPQLGDQVRMTGRETRPFSFRGPFGSWQGSAASIAAGNLAGGNAPASSAALNAMTGAMQLGWQSADVMGFAVGPGQVDAQLANGIINIEPLQIPLSQGTLRLVPRVVLDNSPPVLQLAQGRMVDRVRITPAMCHSWLKYVAPLVADAATAEGEFSVDLNGATLPLETPQMGSADGQLQVHHVRVGPGPLARSLILLAEQLRAIAQQRPGNPNAAAGVTWLEIPEQRVDFRMVDGRVHHQGLEMRVDQMVVRTSGYVDVEQRIAMQAELTVPPAWVANNQLLAGLSGQKLMVPISGTLSQPRLDQRALENVSRQAIGGAVNRALEDQINRGLEKLFGTRNQPPGATVPPPAPNP